MRVPSLEWLQTGAGLGCQALQLPNPVILVEVSRAVSFHYNDENLI